MAFAAHPGQLQTLLVGRAADRGVHMKPFSDGLKIVTQEDAELARKLPPRSSEAHAEDEESPSQLMELLGNIDGLKQEIHERIRRIEAVKQAKSVLLEDAMRTEALSKKLSDLGKVMSAAQLGLLIGPDVQIDADPQSYRRKESSIETEGKLSQPRPTVDNLALPWPKAEEGTESKGIETERLVEQAARFSGDYAVIDSSLTEVKQSFESITHRLNTVEEYLDTVDYGEIKKSLSEAKESVESITNRLNTVENFLNTVLRQLEEVAGDTKLRLEEAVSRYDRALEREDRAAAGFVAAQEALRAASRSAEERLAEAERYWKQADQGTAETQRVLDESTASLKRAVAIEEKVAADLRSAQSSAKETFEAANRRLQEAEQFWKNKDLSFVDAKKHLEQSTFALTEAHAKEEAAAADLTSARQELTTAYQFAAVAAQRRLDASEFFRKAASWTIFATALSWIVMAWTAWFSLRTIVPIWGPCAATVLIVVVALAAGKASRREAGGVD
jgi:hypothetical protein